tara:strand:+ start:11656 stop:11940 length:285 start_codon:yes stop_codon:yes gene_type:complete
MSGDLALTCVPHLMNNLVQALRYIGAPVARALATACRVVKALMALIGSIGDVARLGVDLPGCWAEFPGLAPHEKCPSAQQCIGTVSYKFLLSER